MTDVALVVVLTLAVAVGWLLGRGSKNKMLAMLAKFKSNEAYFQGLNFLLKEQPDKAIEAFVESLEVNSYTLETHLSLGKLMRKQGQVDRAIRIHQNLLARPLLEVNDQHQVHLELARDFMAAGLLDRAEMLLQEVIQESTALRSIAQRYLLDIYQDESEWQDAIHVAQALLQSRYMKSNTDARRELTHMIAHLYCELTDEALSQKNTQLASTYLNRAVATDKMVLRVVIMTADRDNANGRYKQAIKVISKLESQNPIWFFACLPALLKAYMAGGNEDAAFTAFVKHLENYLATQESMPVLMFLVDELLRKSTDDKQKYQQVLALLSNYNQRSPNLLAINKLVEMQLLADGNDIASEVKALHQQVEVMLKNKKIYRCENCGFSGRQMHWRCPSCKKWDTQQRLDQLTK